jgi:hypothetical protein
MQNFWGEMALAVLLLVAAGAWAEQQEDERDPMTCSAIRIISTPPIGRPGRVPVFSVRQILDLNFTVFFPGHHDRMDSVELRLFTPNGHLYQSTIVPVALAEGKKRTVEGYPHPLPVAQLVPHEQDGLESGFAVKAPSFPVAGTLIVADSLYGRWRVEAWPGGAQRACSAHFSLRP